MSIPAGKPHRAIPPSEILEDFLGEYGITQYRLAKETKIPQKRISNNGGNCRSIGIVFW